MDCFSNWKTDSMHSATIFPLLLHIGIYFSIFFILALYFDIVCYTKHILFYIVVSCSLLWHCFWWWNCADCCRLTLAKTKSNYWNVSEFKLTYTNTTNGGQVTAELDPKFIAPTPIGFSYHCFEPDPVGPPNAVGQQAVSVKFQNLQVRATPCGLHHDFWQLQNDFVGSN